VQGWTTHDSIIEWGGKWWLFYADNQLSGKNHLRDVKVTELHFNPDGTIQPVDPFVGPVETPALTPAKKGERG
jgi:hypothetical protein